MEPQKKFTQQIHKIYNQPDHAVTKHIGQLLYQCKKTPDELGILLNQLNDSSTSFNTISFQSWSNFARMLIKTVVSTKNIQFMGKLSEYLLRSVDYFVPYQINQSNSKNFDPLLKICRSVKFSKPSLQKLNSKHITLYLQGQWDQIWNNQFVELINNEVLVDKKNQTSNTFKINPFLSKFISKNFSKFVPQLQRLMIRSENNIEVLVEFLQACGDKLQNNGQQAVNLLKKYKNLFQTKPELSLRLVKFLVHTLNQENYYYQAFEFIKSLLTTQHNTKKKIIYFRMLQGIIKAHKTYNHSQKTLNQIIGCIILSWPKFIQQPQSIFVLDLLNEVLPLVNQPGPEIAQLCKQSLKSQNKYILIFMALTLSYSYTKQQKINQFGSVKDCFNNLKPLLAGFMKKKEASWYFILPIMNFLSTFDLDLIQDITDIQFLFKKSVLALAPIQQRDALNLIANKYLRYLAKNADGQRVQLKDDVCLVIVLLLQNNRRKQFWDSILQQFNQDYRVQIIQKGLYPLIYLQNQTITDKNRNNKYLSLARLLILSLDLKESLKYIQVLQKFACVATYANLKLQNLSLHFDAKALQQVQQKYILLSLLDLKLREQNQKQYISPHMHQINVNTMNNIYSVQSSPGISLINKLLQKLLDKVYYEKDRTFAQNLLKQQVQIRTKHFQTIVNPCKEVLSGVQLLVETKVIKRKIYLNSILDSKMMSEAQVKQEQYREHFEKMLNYFNKIMIQILLKNIRISIRQENSIWQKNFDGFIHIVSYPEHRMSYYRIIKASFENFQVRHTREQQNQYLALKKLFLRYSDFFAQFYSIRGAHLTPPIYLMSKTQKFYSQFLKIDDSILSKTHYSLRFINDLSLYVLENMEFDLSVKQQALNFFYSCIEKEQQIENIQLLYKLLVKNMNIVSTCESIQKVLLYCMRNINMKRYGQLFIEVLNYVNKTKKLILRSLIKISQDKNEKSYQPTFEDYIKLKILALDDSTDQQISKSALKLLNQKQKNSTSIKTTIANFDMTNFIKNNTKDTTEKLCKFMKESINPENINEVFDLVLRTSEQLYNQNFDQQGLQFLPYFLSLNLQIIPEKYLHKIFEILIMKYTANQEFATLTKMSVDTGIDIIKYYANKYGQKMLSTMQSFLTKAKGISNIVFLGVLAPYLKGAKNLNVIEKRITELFKSDNQSQQTSIAKCMPDLMSFFKNPDQIVEKIFEDISKIDQKSQIGQSYLASGLLKGLGSKKMLVYLQKLISTDYPSKTKADKIGRCQLFKAFILNFGRVIQLKAFKIIEILLHYMSDSNEQVRNFSKSVAQIFVTKMSSFSIRQLLPHLLSGLQNQQNWRIKISYIWILGIMANCSAKQLQTSLPVIVPTLSGCLSNAHPAIRDKASEALSLIGQTIRNPEISNSIDILIQALQNPFEKSQKALEILLKTRFSHYIDPPSLSIIVPIIDYCLRGRVSQLKEGACQVIGSISELILNPSDMLPYLKFVGPGIKTALCDPLTEIRSIAAMAIGKISSKIGAQSAKQYFSFIYELIDSPQSNTTQKTGAAQAYAQILCSQGYDYFQESLNDVFTKLAQPRKAYPKEGYILVFLYIPGIRREQFEGFIKEVNQNTYCYVSDEDEALRNSSMQVSKVLINNYGISHTDLLLEPLCEGIFESNWRKRNAALILLGELLNILKVYMFNSKDYQKNEYYYQALMAVYIEKDDDLEMPRQTANYVWNTYIQNTPKTIRSGLNTLVKMWTKFTHAAQGVVERNITGFAVKYGQNFFTQILEYLANYTQIPEHQEGVFKVLGQFFKRMTQQFISKPTFKNQIRRFFDNQIFKVDGKIRKALTDCLSLYVQKMHQQQYFQNLLYPTIDKMSELNEQNPEYTNMLHLLRDLLHNTASARVVQRLITKVTEAPLSEFKIQVITNNTDKIANNLYSSFKIPATQSILEQIIVLINNGRKSNRLALLVYCMDQVSIKLHNKYKNQYINMLIKYLRTYKNKKGQLSKQQYLGVVGKILQMLVFFLNSIDLAQIQSLDELIGQISPHIFDGTDTIRANAHRIFMFLISDHKAAKTGLYYKQMIVSLENQNTELQNRNFTIWNQQNILKDYITILVKGLAYGNTENIQDNIQMTRFLIKNADPKILDPLITKILGPIIRVSSYSLYQRQKQKLLQFIKDLYCKGYNGALQVYNYQVVSVCIRILNQSKLLNKKTADLTDQVTKTLFYVITKQTNNRNRQLLLNLILQKAKGQILAQLLYKLLDQIIRQNFDILSSAIYQKIKTNFKKKLEDTEEQIGVKGLYFLSKTIALIQVQASKEQQSTKSVSIVMTYQDLILYLQRTYFKKQAVPKMDKIQLLLKQSSREKVYYILRCLHDCCLANTRTQEIFTSEYIRSLVPEALSGFEDIVEILEYFD